MLVNPETIDSFRSQYKPKLALLGLIYLSLSTSSPNHLELPPQISSTVPLTTAALDQVGPPPPAPERSLTPPAPLHPIARESPITAPYLAGQDAVKTEGGERGTLQADRLTMPVKGSTSQDANSSTWVTTPPLSDPPPKRSQGPNVFTAASKNAELLEARGHEQAELRSQGESEAKQMGSAGLDRAEGLVLEASTRCSSELDTKKEGDIAETMSDPQFPSKIDTSECPIDYRGRPLCPNMTRQPVSLRKRSSELADALAEFGVFFLSSLHSLFLSILRIRFSPFFLFFGLIHLLQVVQLASLAVEDSIIRVGLANPLPPDFARAKSFGKRMTRLRWRCKAMLSRYWRQISVLSILVFVVGAVGKECVKGTRETLGQDVPFAPWLLPEIEATTEENEKVYFKSFRDLTLLETLSALISLCQPIKHLLPTSILPPTLTHFPFLDPSSLVSTPHLTSFFPGSRSNSPMSHRGHPCPSRISLETSWLISLLVDALTSLVTLFQFALVTFALPSWSPFTLGIHIVFHSCRPRIKHIMSLRASLFRTIECLRTVFTVFPEMEDDLGRVTKDDDWVCTICFEGAECGTLAGEETSERLLRGKTTNEKCRLPCGHKYHAGCLVHWLTYQAWCPVCHLPVVGAAPSPPTSSWSTQTPPAPNNQRQPFANTYEYPGNVRRRPSSHFQSTSSVTETSH